MSVREFLEFFADAFQLTGARHRAAVDLSWSALDLAIAAASPWSNSRLV